MFWCMSISFHGTKKDASARHGRTVVRLFYSDGEERYLNLANLNAAPFLRFLGLSSDQDPYLAGQADFPTVRRAIMKARASFDRKVDQFTRAEETVIGENGCVSVTAGIDREYFARRLDDLSIFVEDLAREGADSLSWG